MSTENEPKLQKQLVQLVERVQGGIQSLQGDPMQDFFQLELNQLNKIDSWALEDANARLQALKQLSHLVYQHCVKIQNPDFAEPVRVPDSVLTVQARMPANVLDSAKKYNFSIDPGLLHDNDRANDLFDPVSPTAKIVGYLRGQDPSLALAADILDGNEGATLLDELAIHCDATRKLMACLFQSRYHAMNASISCGENIHQVIEFAAGISPRGFQWSQTSPGTIYIESDLPQLMIHKSKLIRNALIRRDSPGRGILHCCAVDVLDRKSMLDAVKNLDCERPMTFVTEGLLLYFDKWEMQQFWGNMQMLLNEFPNSNWVTDLVTKQNLADLLEAHAGVAKAVRDVFRLTNREVVAHNPFNNDECVKQHLNNFGLTTRSSLELREALSLVPIGEAGMQAAANMVGNRRVWQIIAS